MVPKIRQNGRFMKHLSLGSFVFFHCQISSLHYFHYHSKVVTVCCWIADYPLSSIRLLQLHTPLVLLPLYGFVVLPGLEHLSRFLSYKLWFSVTSFRNDSDNDNNKSIVLTSGLHHYTNHLELRTQFDLEVRYNNAILLMFVIALRFMYTVYTVYINRKVFLSNILSCLSRDLGQDHFS